MPRVNIMVGDGMTVGEITTAQTGTERDNNYTKMIVVNKYGIVTETYMTLGEAKTDVVCPEGDTSSPITQTKRDMP